MIRVIDVLKEHGLSSGAANKALKSGKVWVHGVPSADGGREVRPDQVEYRERAPRMQPGKDPALLYKDEHLAVVYKPSGMLSVAAPKRGRDTNLVSELAQILGRAMPVHRLDEGTSGVMVVARSEVAQKALKAEWEKQKVEREYLAMVQGFLSQTEARVETHIARHPHTGRWASRPEHEGGRRAVTFIQGLATLPRRTGLVRARLETGRTHQVRIHLAEAGNPVLGDPLYGTRSTFPRLALHAAVLRFEHPLSGRALAFDTGLPDDMEKYRRFLLSKDRIRKPQ